jgi:hypothetical protein
MQFRTIAQLASLTRSALHLSGLDLSGYPG